VPVQNYPKLYKNAQPCTKMNRFAASIVRLARATNYNFLYRQADRLNDDSKTRSTAALGRGRPSSYWDFKNLRDASSHRVSRFDRELTDFGEPHGRAAERPVSGLQRPIGQNNRLTGEPKTTAPPPYPMPTTTCRKTKTAIIPQDLTQYKLITMKI
jgi:hypothetical protein